ncbi:THAP4-heme-bd domain-containing protein [Aphelenchoides fujianensis]|nr:THAP4-heme-bd domain-containing protein [Aphelenchoides fujianensis]
MFFDRFLLFSLFVCFVNAALNEHNQKLHWLVGKWRSEFSGKVVWPTVPTMTYGEELIINEAPQARTTNVQARAWSHSTKDHFHDEWGFLTVDPNGNATLDDHREQRLHDV